MLRPIVLLALVAFACSKDACKSYNSTECALHSDACSICKLKLSPVDVSLCLKYNTSVLLPPAVFDCTPAPTDAQAAAQNPIPEVCEAYIPAECGRHMDTCSLCKNTFSGVEQCFSAATAEGLPPQIFGCNPARVAYEAEVTKPIPEVCEMYTPAECALHKDSCSLCKNAFSSKELCFDTVVAAKLAPQIFTCDPLPATKPVPEPAAVQALLVPVPEICEMFNATECGLHANCSLCKQSFIGVEICFEKEIAAKLPPQIFQCTPAPEPPSLQGPARPIPEVCEMYTPAACALHKDSCSLCKNIFSGKELCFAATTAATLVPQIFTCDPLPEPKPATALALPGPIPEICEMFNATECGLHANCALCKQAFIGVEICFEKEIAAKLPPQIFQCIPAPEPPSLQAPAKPMPEVCEMYTPAECALHKDSCSLCKNTFSGKELCFAPTTAATLAPQIFKCTPAPPAPVTEVTKPIPEVCELYTPAQCALHKDSCSLCKNAFSGKELCFAPTTAAKLAPQIFTCDPKPASVAVDAPNHDACYSKDEAACATTLGCVWCTGSHAPDGCYFEEKAERLPTSQFQCRFRTSLTSSRRMLAR